MSAFRLPLLYLGVIVAPLAFLLGVRFFTEDELPGVTASSEPLVTQATDREVRDQQPLNLELEWTEGRELVAPDWDGTITAVYVAAGTEVTSGQRVVAVDGVDRFAFASARPFYRELRSGDTGADVVALNEMLVALGYLAALPFDPATYPYSTYQAVYNLEAALGIGRPTGVFDPGLVAWLPESPFAIATLEPEVAAGAPGAGQAWAVEPARLASARLTPSQPNQPLRFEPGVEYVLRVDALEVPFDPVTQMVTAEGLALLEGVATPPEAGSNGGQAGGPPTGGDAGGSLSGLVERRVPLLSRAVPATSVVVNAAGALCVWQPAAVGGWEAVTVRVAGSRAGVTDVVEGLEAGVSVLANPADVLADPACP